jgi:hypothetical protein
MHFPPDLALRITKFIVPATSYALEHFKSLDQPSCRRFIYTIESLSYRSERACGNVLMRSGCYRNILKIAKSYNTYAQPKTVEAALFAVAAGCVHGTLNGYLKRKLGVLNYLEKNALNFKDFAGKRKKHVTRAILLARSNLIKPPAVIRDGADFKTTLDKLAQIVNKKQKTKKSAGGDEDSGGEDSITFGDYHNGSTPRSNMNKKHRHQTGTLDRSGLSRWMALGAFAKLTGHPARGHEICKEIVGIPGLIQNVVVAAQTHYVFYGTFGSTLGQLEAMDILVNMCQRPAGVLLWLQFSEEHKMAMDHSGTVVPMLEAPRLAPPADETHAHSLTHGVTRCAKCRDPYINSRDRSVLETFEFERPGQWQYIPKFHKKNSPAYQTNKATADAANAVKSKSKSKQKPSTSAAGAGKSSRMPDGHDDDTISTTIAAAKTPSAATPRLSKKRFGAAWLCPMCYADDITDPRDGRRNFAQKFSGVPGTHPAWIYREQQFDAREGTHGLPTRSELGERKMRSQHMAKKLLNAQEMHVEMVEIEEIRADLNALKTSQRQQLDKEQRLRDNTDAKPFPLGTYVTVFIPNEDHSFSKMTLYNGQRAVIKRVVQAYSLSARRREKFGEDFWYEIAFERELQSQDSLKQRRRHEVKTNHVFFAERRRIPPIRWGAKFGAQSKIVIPGAGVAIPSEGWTVSVWFRGGSWIRRLRSNLRFLTLCESSDGSKLIALDRDMQLGCFSTAHEENEHNPTWHCTEESILQLGERMQHALGTRREDFLRDEPGHWLRLVVVAHRGRRANQNMSFWLGYASEDELEVDMFRLGTISGFFPHSTDIKFVGNSKDGYQHWGPISDFRLYKYAFDTTEQEAWPGRCVPPVNAGRLEDIMHESQAAMGQAAPKTNQVMMLIHEADVLQTQYEVVQAGAIGCLSVVIRKSTLLPIRRAAMRAIAVVASSVRLRSAVIEMNGLVDKIFETCHDLDPELALWSRRAVAALL